MTETSHHDDRIAKMAFAPVYPHYVSKEQKKGRTMAELHQDIEGATGFYECQLQL